MAETRRRSDENILKYILIKRRAGKFFALMREETKILEEMRAMPTADVYPVVEDLELQLDQLVDVYSRPAQDAVEERQKGFALRRIAESMGNGMEVFMRCVLGSVCFKDRADLAALSQCATTPEAAYLTLCKCPKTPLDA